MNSYHETQTIWVDQGWVCSHCLQEARTKYIATGHDHTDYEYDICDCTGAKQHGKPYGELK